MLLSNFVSQLIAGAGVGVFVAFVLRTKLLTSYVAQAALGVAGALSVAWFIAPLSLRVDPGNLAEVSPVTALGSIVAIGLGRFFGLA